MITIDNMKKSPKQIGRHEIKIITLLSEYFKNNDYQVFSKSSFNIAWGNVISDIDILVLKDQKIGYVEVKSKHDNFDKAYSQVEKAKSYVDYAWIATDKVNPTCKDDVIGLIKINNGVIEIIKEPQLITSIPDFYSIFSLKKKCLLKLVDDKNIPLLRRYKYDIAKMVYQTHYSKRIKELLKIIVTCKNDCNECPLEKMENYL